MEMRKSVYLQIRLNKFMRNVGCVPNEMTKLERNSRNTSDFHFQAIGSKEVRKTL